MSIGKRIRDRRKHLGLTQMQLAERLGLQSKAAISTVENDKESMTVDRIKKYAVALETTPAYLQEITDDPEYIIINMKSEYQNLDGLADALQKPLSKSEEAAPPSMDAEMQMLTFLYGALSKENKMKIVETMQLMLLRQKGEKDDD